MAHKLGLRQRVAVALAMVCIAVVGALGVTLYMASDEMENGLVEQIVSEEMESLVQRLNIPGTSAPPNGPNLQYYVLKTAADYERLDPQLLTLPPGQHEIGSGVNERHVGVRDVDGVRYIVSYDAGAHELREESYQRLIMLALASAAIVAVALGYWLAGLLTQQLTELAAKVSRLAPDERHPPLERPEHDREVAAVARALDDYNLRIIEMMQREQEFTANASHELRTPLTAIRTSCELLAAETGLSDKGRSRLDMIETAAEQMTDHIESLLYLARQHPPTVAESVELRECVTEAAAPLREEIVRKGLVFEVPIDPSAVVTLDRKALQLVLGNLIRNAVRYTEQGFVRVSYDAKRLTVADSGAGITQEHLPRVFDRFYRGTTDVEGLGLGLAIVRRVCDELGWKIEVESRPGVGSAFSLVLA